MLSEFQTKTAFKNLSTSLMRGINYGTLDLDESKWLIIRDHRTEDEIVRFDKKQVKNANINKGELNLELQPEEDEGDQLFEARFWFSEGMETKNETEMKPQVKETLAEKCLKNILKESKLESAAGEIVVSLQDVNFVAPRGKYSVNFYPRHLGLHGKTFSHRVQYKQIKKGFILPLNNEAQVAIVLDLSRPLTQGQTHHNYLVLQIRKDTTEDMVMVNRKALQGSDRIAKIEFVKDSYSGEQFQIIVDLLFSIAAISLIQPSLSYKSVTGQSSVRGSYKAQFGWLYMLKNSLIFIPRPVCYIKVSEIGKVDFERAGAFNKNFDIKFAMKGQEKSIEIKSVDKAEMEKLADYFRQRSIHVQMERPARTVAEEPGEDSQNQEEDEDFQEEDVKESSFESSNEDEIGSEEQSEVTREKKKKKSKKLKRQK